MFDEDLEVEGFEEVKEVAKPSQKHSKADVSAPASKSVKELPIVRDEAIGQAQAIDKNVHFMKAQEKFINGQKREITEEWIGNPREKGLYVDGGGGELPVEDL